MSFEFYPNDVSDLKVPNVQSFLDFIESCNKKSNFNVGIYGSASSCKTTLCNFLIDYFVKEQIKKCDGCINPSKDEIRQIKSKILYVFENDDDLNINNIQSHINIFCKRNIKYDKMIYIENFDDFSESNQQQLKLYMDHFHLLKTKNKTHFIIEVNESHKVRDIIETRIRIFETIPLNKSCLVNISNDICARNNIYIDEDVLHYLLQIGNVNIKNMINIFKKAWLLDKKVIDKDSMQCISYLIDFNDFDQFMDLLQNAQYFEGCKVLNKFYVDGYDVSDILYFFYQYCKIKCEAEETKLSSTVYYDIINILCCYINEIYKGLQHHIILNYLAYDIYKIVHEINDYHTLVI